MDDEDGGLLNIEISEDEEQVEKKEARRTGQTEEAWKAIQREYKPKVEDGHIRETLNLPLQPASSKQDVQQVLHAVEELYFFRRYVDALALVRTVTADSHDFDDEAQKLFSIYQERCNRKIMSMPDSLPSSG